MFSNYFRKIGLKYLKVSQQSITVEEACTTEKYKEMMRGESVSDNYYLKKFKDYEIPSKTMSSAFAEIKWTLRRKLIEEKGEQTAQEILNGITVGEAITYLK